MSSPKNYRIFHISPGLVRYAESSGQEIVALVKKEVLDEMNFSFRNKPVFSEHKLIEIDDVFDFKNGDPEEKADGVVNDVGYDEYSGRFYVDATIWDEETQANIEKGYGASNAYIVEKVGTAGLHNDVPYDEEILEGSYHHLAIVESPRYSDTQIIQNSKTGGLIMKFKLLGKLGKKGKNQLDKSKVLTNETPTDTPAEKAETMEMNAGASIEVDGQVIPVSDMVEAYMASKNQAVENEASPDEAMLSMEDTILVDGEEVSVQALYEAYAASNTGAEGDLLTNSKTATKTPAKDTEEEAPNRNYKLLQNAVDTAPAEDVRTSSVITETKRLVVGKAKYGTIKENGNV